MSVDAQEGVDPARQQRTDEAMQVVEPAQNPRIGPRLIPVVVTIVIGIVIVALLYLAPWG